MTEQSATNHHQKIKAEWTKTANSEIYGQSEDDCRVKIINQIVLIPNKNSNNKNRKKKSESKKCGLCERIFANLETFNQHQETHENIFFDCPESGCDKKFKRKSSLRKHLYFHKGKFKYSCKFKECDENFVDLVKYEVHLASKHQRIERIFNCQLCTKTFTSSDYLKRHQTTHKNEFKYSCKTCNQKFKWLTSLQTHTQIHTQNKTMMQCQDCQKTFFNQRTLDRHVKIHQNVRYQCGVCKVIASNRKDNIIRHIRHLHSEIASTDVVKHVKTMERKISNDLMKDTSEELEINNDTDDDDEEDNVLIIDESVREEAREEPSTIINNRVNVIQSIGNPNKNIPPHSSEYEIRLPPKKKVYNPIAQYRAILGLSDLEHHAENSRISNSEEVFPDHWRKRTAQKLSYK